MLPNFVKSLESATGKYIAICDGDDYWIDPYKLQKQIDFLEKNPDYSSCYTNSLVREEETGKEMIAKNQIWDTADSAALLLHDDFNKDNIPLSPGHISGFVFRNNLINPYPKWFLSCNNVTDFPLYMMISKYGKAKFINEITSVYRTHKKSISTAEYSVKDFHCTRIFMYKNVDAYLDKKYHKQIRLLVSKHFLSLSKFYFKRKNFTQFLRNFLHALFNDYHAVIKSHTNQ